MNDWYLNHGFKIYDSITYRNESLIFSHNDLNSENVLWNKKYFFIYFLKMVKSKK